MGEAGGLCSICFGPPRQPSGTLLGCGHAFCLACIDGWAQIENSCPLCKRRFSAIEVGARCARRLLPVSPATQHALAAEERCYVCGREDRPERAFVCEACERRVCHMRCLDPPLTEIPTDSWYCDFCVRERRLTPTLPLASIFRRKRERSRRRLKRAQREQLRRLQPRPVARRRAGSLGGLWAGLSGLRLFRSPLSRGEGLRSALLASLPRVAGRPP